MSEKRRIIHVAWDPHLQISEGDEIETTRGILDKNTGDVRASRMKNITTGREEGSEIEGIMATTMPTDINPHQRNCARNSFKPKCHGI